MWVLRWGLLRTSCPPHCVPGLPASHSSEPPLRDRRNPGLGQSLPPGAPCGWIRVKTRTDPDKGAAGIFFLLEFRNCSKAFSYHRYV